MFNYKGNKRECIRSGSMVGWNFLFLWDNKYSLGGELYVGRFFLVKPNDKKIKNITLSFTFVYLPLYIFYLHGFVVG